MSLASLNPNNAAEAVAVLNSLIARGEAAQDLIRFTSYTKPDYKPASHHHRVAQHLQEVEQGRIDRLMVFAPPRHGKSELSTRRFPAWYLGRHPDRHIISASYNADLATDFGREVRDIVADTLYWELFPDVDLKPDSKAANRWHTNQGGIYVGAGVGSGITGRGAHLLLVDDPFKDRKEAESKTIRDAVWDWYKSTAYTRLMPGGAVVVTLTRWHDDDLAGRLLREMSAGGDRWTIVSLPALAEPGDLLGREEGAPLWPEWFPLATLERIRAVVGSYEWLSLYQQRPVAEEGNIFKRSWWRTYRDLPDFSFVCQSWDTAHETKRESDWSVCTTWGVCAGHIYLIDWFKGKLLYPDLRRKVEVMAVRYRPQAILVGDTPGSKPLIQELTTQSTLPILPIKEVGDKVARAHAATPMVEGARVLLPEWASWTTEFVDEMGRFPRADHDDTVDSTTLALNYLRSRTYDESFTADDAARLRSEFGLGVH